MSAKTDFPFYNGQPMAITGTAWLALLASVAAAFWLLISLPLQTAPFNVIPAIAYTGLPLLVLAALTGGRHRALFGRFGFRQFGLAIGFGILALIVSLGLGLVLFQFVPMTANPAAGMAASIGLIDLPIFLIRTFVQLVGEEVMTILPLLAVLWFCVSRLGLTRTWGLIIAVIVSTLWFAAAHLPTYDWNVIQCFGAIGTARLVLTAAYLVTRNLWVSAGAHIVNDWVEFFLPSLLGELGGHTPIEPGA